MSDSRSNRSRPPGGEEGSPPEATAMTPQPNAPRWLPAPASRTRPSSSSPGRPSSAHTSPLLQSLLPGLLLLSCLLLPAPVDGLCRFPDFMQRGEAPWAASYGMDAQMVMYVKGTYMSISQQKDHQDTVYTRRCERRAPENKYLVSHQEEGLPIRFLCMQFLKRSENIVQMKVSMRSARQTPELCDERNMAIDRWPIVQMSQSPSQKIPCPFLGGYNVNMFYPNDTALCADSTLLMRIESECERGEGVVFDFRQDECVPSVLPRVIKQQAYCIAHWIQDSHTFIILQHAVEHKQTWCLRISDPLTDISSAHLMLDLVCDTSDVIKDTRNFFRLTMQRRVYASTCEDEIESDVCQDMKHLCKTIFKRQCARTCGACQSEMVDCAFEETYRGQWVESNARGGDSQLTVGPYSMTIDNLGTYDCLRLEPSKKHRDKRVLVRFDDKGCYPRYTCVEMDKISSSVMRFRLGDRHQWPLPKTRDQKDHVCAAENFLFRNSIETRFHEKRPARLLVRESNVNRVPCGLPPRLQNGIAFSEEGHSCSGCLMFKPSVAGDRFVVRPHNCSVDPERAALPQHRLTTIEYSCLAAFTFHNNTHAVVTKANEYGGWGVYLCWMFTPDGYIKVMKAAEALYMERDPSSLKQDLLQAQFSISRDDGDQLCHNVITIVTPSLLEPSNTRRPVWVAEEEPRPRPTPYPGYPEGGARGTSTYGPEVAVTYRFSTVRLPNSQQTLEAGPSSAAASLPLPVAAWLPVPVPAAHAQWFRTRASLAVGVTLLWATTGLARRVLCR